MVFINQGYEALAFMSFAAWESPNTPPSRPLHPTVLDITNRRQLSAAYSISNNSCSAHLACVSIFSTDHQVWYFRRLNLHSNLYSLMLRSQLLNNQQSRTFSTTNDPSRKGTVIINLMWDNLKLQENAEKPPLYCVWHHSKCPLLLFLLVS